MCIMVGAQEWPATYLIYIVETQVCGLPRVFVFLSTTEATTAVELVATRGTGTTVPTYLNQDSNRRGW